MDGVPLLAAEPSPTPGAQTPPAVGAATASSEGGAAVGGVSEEAEAKKALGNAAYQDKQFDVAIRLYSEAIAEAGDASAPSVYFSNRAVCRAALGEWLGAREDAANALQRPAGVTKKALFQKARAEFRLQLPAEAEETLRLAEGHGLRVGVERLLQDEGLTAAAPPAAQAAPPPASAPAMPQQPDAAGRAKDAGTARYKAGAYTEALAEYQRALELLPSDGDVVDERRAPLLGNAAAACLMLHRADDCCAMCEQSLALDPGNSKVRERLAKGQVARGDFSQARETLARGRACGTNDASAEAALLGAATQIDEWERLLAEADAALAGGEPAKALNSYSDLESKALFDCPALALKMGRCLLEMKRYPQVLHSTQRVLRSNPRNIGALVLRAEALYRNNSNEVDSRQFTEVLEQAQKLLREALSFDPDHAGAQAFHKRLRTLVSKHAELRLLFDAREFEKAREVLDCMVENGVDNPVMLASLYCERAKAGIRAKDWRGVIKDVGQATYRNHELVQPYVYRAQALQALDRHEDAVTELEGLFSWHREQNTYDKLQEAKFLVRKKKRANYYELLCVPSVASQLEIKKAYRERAAEWHPDKKGHLDEDMRKNAEEMFKRIGEAYEVLTDIVKKEFYDKGYDLEGIEEQIEMKKRRTNGGQCRPSGCGHHH